MFLDTVSGESNEFWDLATFAFFMQPGTTAHDMVPTTFRVALFTSISPI